MTARAGAFASSMVTKDGRNKEEEERKKKEAEAAAKAAAEAASKQPKLDNRVKEMMHGTLSTRASFNEERKSTAEAIMQISCHD